MFFFFWTPSDFSVRSLAPGMSQIITQPTRSNFEVVCFELFHHHILEDLQHVNSRRPCVTSWRHTRGHARNSANEQLTVDLTPVTFVGGSALSHAPRPQFLWRVLCCCQLDCVRLLAGHRTSNLTLALSSQIADKTRRGSGKKETDKLTIRNQFR